MISSNVIEEIGTKVLETGVDESVLGLLRNQWPDIHFTYCMEDDIYHAKPAYESNGFSIYLVDNSNHCISFTSNPEAATGVVIAESEDE